MTIKEKIYHTDAFAVNLYKEGVFWTAYEQSAYAVCQIKPYTARKKYVKAVSAEVVSVGFPDSVLESILSAFEVLEKSELQVNLKTREPIDLKVFETWKLSLPIQVSVDKMEKAKAGMLESELINKLRSFDLSNATPMQCMIFLSSIKKELKIEN
ncbi:MAG: hypothetical protein LBI15_05665 [Dysgonamonadaceae bacterium]|nr:hypothetical protein [Dysgonamonadaceae bacterium]